MPQARGPRHGVIQSWRTERQGDAVTRLEMTIEVFARGAQHP